jgi:hypothetical protein
MVATSTVKPATTQGLPGVALRRNPLDPASPDSAGSGLKSGILVAQDRQGQAVFISRLHVSDFCLGLMQLRLIQFENGAETEFCTGSGRVRAPGSPGISCSLTFTRSNAVLAPGQVVRTSREIRFRGSIRRCRASSSFRREWTPLFFTPRRLNRNPFGRDPPCV